MTICQFKPVFRHIPRNEEIMREVPARVSFPTNPKPTYTPSTRANGQMGMMQKFIQWYAYFVKLQDMKNALDPGQVPVVSPFRVGTIPSCRSNLNCFLLSFLSSNPTGR